MSNQPEATHVTFTEGGEWHTFPCRDHNGPEGILVHSIRFSDGSVWDAHNGWRRSRQ